MPYLNLAPMPDNNTAGLTILTAMASASTPDSQTESSDMDLTSIAGQSPFNSPQTVSLPPIRRKLSYGMAETQLVDIIKRAVTESVGDIIRVELDKARHQVGSGCISCQCQNLDLDTKPSSQHLRHPSKIPVRSSTPRRVPTPRSANPHTRSNSINPQFTLGHRNNRPQEQVPQIQNASFRPQRVAYRIHQQTRFHDYSPADRLTSVQRVSCLPSPLHPTNRGGSRCSIDWPVVEGSDRVSLPANVDQLRQEVKESDENM
jgi:hypothetical protein